MFWQTAKTTFVFALVLVTGCATGPSAFRLPGLSTPRTTSARSTSSAESRLDSPGKQTEQPDDPGPKRQPLIAKSTFAEKTRRHDAATRALIEQAVRDLPTAERAEWLDYLETVDSALVPYLLESQLAKSNTASPSSPSNQNERSSHSESPTDISSNEILQTSHPSQSSVGHSLGGQRQQPEKLLVVNPEGLQLLEESEESDTSRATQVPATAEVGAPLQEPELTTTSSQPASQDVAPEPARDWSGRLRSITDWEHNPLKFQRESDEGAEEIRRERRPKQLPQIIANPTQMLPNPFAKAEAEPTPRRTITEPLVISPPATGASRTPENLRIAPGAQLWDAELSKLVALMEAEATDPSQNGNGTLTRNELRQHVALRLLYLINDQTSLAMQPIPGLEPADQEFWTAIFWGLADYLNQSGVDPRERSTKTLEQLRSAAHYLQTTAKLQLRNVNFCTQIQGFGNFEEFQQNVFNPGQPVLIYCDIRNFRSELNKTGEFVTRLRSTLEIHQGGLNGPLLDRNTFAASEDRCRTMRSDFYNSYRIDLPEHLSPGTYVLKLTVYDELSDKMATETIDFLIR